MGPVVAVTTCLRKYATFSGRASRSEFWWFLLALCVLSSLIQTIVNSNANTLSLKFGLNFRIGTESSIAENLFTLLFIVPYIAVIIRRLHDTGTPGYVALIFASVSIGLIYLGAAFVAPQVAIIVVVIALIIATLWLTRPSGSGLNRYGANPFEAAQ